jgi:NAD(P)-dependent dehydrogenase (short-subunit alcohol dehydrogenase family)
VATVTSKRDAKIIVLTGGTRGCGAALVEYFADQGHVVISCGRRSDRVADLRERFGAMHDFTELDITDAESVERWALRVITTHGAPDLLINNAAVIAPNAPLWKVPAEEIQRVLATNISGTVNTVRHFVPAMIANKRGVIVNFSSGWGRSTAPEVGIYCASKFAIEGLTQSLSQELPKGLAAVALNPGIIDTEMLRSCFGGEATSYPKPKQWAKNAGPFLLSLSARDNGSSLDVPSGDWE